MLCFQRVRLSSSRRGRRGRTGQGVATRRRNPLFIYLAFSYYYRNFFFFHILLSPDRLSPRRRRKHNARHYTLAYRRDSVFPIDSVAENIIPATLQGVSDQTSRQSKVFKIEKDFHRYT